MKKYTLSLLVALAIAPAATQAQLSFSQRTVAENIFIPWEIIYGPDGNIWFTQKNGYICRVAPETGIIDTLYHESATVIRGEGGMLGMALHPGFPAQPQVFVAYEYLDGADYKEQIVRYTYGSDALTSPEIILDNIDGSVNHNGCRLLAIGDKLFITTGDAENLDNPQDLSSINGKVLRINFDGTIPADNPDPASPIWSWGHRNAQGLTYHEGRIYSSEHGPSSDDEINLIDKGGNYGWPDVAGYCDDASEIAFCSDSSVTEPLRAWTPTLAVSGLDYYNHPMFPSLQNSLLMATLKDNNLYQLSLNEEGDSIISATAIDGIDLGRLRDICISPEGKIYISTSNSGAAGTGEKIDKIVELYDPSFTSLAQTYAEDPNVMLFPNPGTSLVTLQYNLTEYQSRQWSYVLYTNEGREVQSGQIEDNQIDISKLNQGLYYLKATSKELSFFKRLVKW